MTLWQIWKARNACLFENLNPDPMFIMTQASNLLEEFWRVKGWMEQPSQKETTRSISSGNGHNRWKKPEGNHIKINSDCAFLENERTAAVAFVVRDSNGWLLDGRAHIVYAESALMAEATALFEAVLYVQENQLEEVHFEFDNQELINCLVNDSSPSDWRCTNLLEIINISRKLIGNHSYNWISRKANSVADWVARVTLGWSCPEDWVQRPPLQLGDLLEADASSLLEAPD